MLREKEGEKLDHCSNYLTTLNARARVCVREREVRNANEDKFISCKWAPYKAFPIKNEAKTGSRSNERPLSWWQSKTKNDVRETKAHAYISLFENKSGCRPSSRSQRNAKINARQSKCLAPPRWRQVNRCNRVITTPEAQIRRRVSASHRHPISEKRASFEWKEGGWGRINAGNKVWFGVAFLSQRRNARTHVL